MDCVIGATPMISVAEMAAGVIVKVLRVVSQVTFVVKQMVAPFTRLLSIGSSSLSAVPGDVLGGSR
jgi:hypothetical protein